MREWQEEGKAMKASIRRWMVGTFLLGALAFAGAPASQAQSRVPYESREGTRVDLWQDRHELNFLQEQVERDKREIRQDSWRYGSNSFQVRADRARLARDERDLRELKRDMKRDRRFVHLRSYRWRQ